MASKAPPVPPAQRAGRSPGAASSADATRQVKQDPARDAAALNLKQQGRYGAIHQNLTHQGRQQDR